MAKKSTIGNGQKIGASCENPQIKTPANKSSKKEKASKPARK
ncbi:hypothetical protein [Methanosarcina sp.]|nr:hypothetical protein [Methanosarcina sp.]MDW5551010.1 hypothetical protein [Methanosarcina sp.]MDW5555394.1 hypothetical protein [Methanosarcina sp.]MDW5561034.1 hypothetical protein [Methanosarcina sp.]